jgi:hypothetical protein
MKRGDRVRDWQGAVEGCGIGTVESIDGGVATVRFSNVVADLPVSHLEVVSPVVHIVHFVNEEGDQTTFGPFTGVADALAWIDGRRIDHPDMGGHFTIDMLTIPATWDYKS